MTPVGDVLVVVLTLIGVSWMFWQMWKEDTK